MRVPKREFFLKEGIPLLGISLLAGVLFHSGHHLGAFFVLLVYLLLQLYQGWRFFSNQAVLPLGMWPRLEALFQQCSQQQASYQKACQQRLHQREEMLQTLPIGLVYLAERDEIQWVNTAAMRLLQLREVDQGKPLQQLLRLPEFVSWLEQGKEEPLKLIMPRARLMVLRFRQLAFKQGRLLLVEDVTAEYDLEQVRRDFVANASHELRTPLTVFRGYLETFLDMEDTLPPLYRQAMMQMHQQVTRMHQIIEDLLTLSAIERNQRVVDPQPVNVAALMRQLETEAAQLSQQRHQLVFKALTAKGIMGDPMLLHSIFTNLISNAIRYTPEGGRITVRWYEDALGRGVFEVEDTGIGIPRDHLARLTERFYRVDKARSRERGGTGLGLAIVKHALEQHEGWLEIESTPQVGSKFRAIFPATRVIEM